MLPEKPWDVWIIDAIYRDSNFREERFAVVLIPATDKMGCHFHFCLPVTHTDHTSIGWVKIDSLRTPEDDRPSWVGVPQPETVYDSDMLHRARPMGHLSVDDIANLKKAMVACSKPSYAKVLPVLPDS